MTEQVKNKFPYIQWMSIFLLVRLLMLAGFFIFTSGREVASDVDFHIMLINSPFGILLGTADPLVNSYPPLQSFITAPLYHFFSLVFGSFLSFRLMMISIESVAFAAFLYCCSRADSPRVPTWLLPSLFILAPYQIFTTLVFVQDEIIGQCLLLIAAALLIVDRHETSRTAWVFFILAAGILLGKIFLLLSAIWLFLFHWNYRTHPWRQGLLAGGAVFAVYIIVMLAAAAHKSAIPLIGFSPESNYGVTLWPMFIDIFSGELSRLKNTSLTVSSIALFLLFTLCLIKTNFLKTELNPLALLVTPIALFLLFFYQHNSEYPVLIAPICLLLCRSVMHCLIVWLAITLSWVPKFLFGLKNVGSNNANTSATRDELLSTITSLLPVDFATLHVMSVTAYSGIWAILTAGLVYILYSRPTQTNPSQPEGRIPHSVILTEP